ncbi:MAG TPA: hypothetical protein VMW36_00755 [Patescibacteria group bacterium]|nr:hypothetical protein [Patescibacteria group bacterium]
MTTEEERKLQGYGKERRVISFEDKDGNLARLIVKLRHESLSRAEFYRAITLGFIEDNPLLDDFILGYKKQKEFFRKSRQKILNDERALSSESTKRFGLDPDEIEDLFDLFDEEQGL